MAGVPRLPGAYQPFEEEAHRGPVVDRATFFPVGQYEDGSFTFAWPGLLKDAWEGGQRTFLDSAGAPVPDAAPGAKWSSNVDALNAASIAPMAGVAGRMSGAIPRGALGSGGSDMVSKSKGITAYHGSPHDFDKFSLEKIGTGEGAQAYGHGLYFAEREGVAHGYRDRLSGSAAFRANEDSAALNYLKSAGGDVGKAIAESDAWIDQLTKAGARKVPKLSERLDMEIAANDLLKRQSRGETVINDNPGRMYEVRINAEPEQFLDWDKSVAEQTPAVRDQLAAFGLSDDAKAFNILQGIVERMRVDGRISGGRDLGVQVSDELRGAGLPGIRYLDQGSRNAGTGSSNYVVFDDALIDIMRKYANPETALLPYLSSGFEREELPAWRPMD